MRRSRVSVAMAVAMIAGGAGAPSAAAASNAPEAPTLASRSILPAKTYVPGSEPSGYWTTGNAAVPAPYPGQPVQGFSATHKLGDSSYLVMSDNGFGSKANSADFLLAVHRIRPNAPKAGQTDYINTVFTLSDPKRLVPWPIWRDGGCQAAEKLPAGYACPLKDRKLTGADFDPESMQIAADGTFWFGEEFGPYLLHTDSQGRLLEAPIPTPGVQSPSNPTLNGEKPNLADSKGFEGMAISPDRKTLYPMLEGAVTDDATAGKPELRRIYEVKRGRYTGKRWNYAMEKPDHAVGDFIAINNHEFLVIERDDTEGDKATFKRIYRVDINRVDKRGYVRKQELVDLMKVADPRGIGGGGSVFSFPFFTIEDVELVDADTIAVMNDNNFPAVGGRSSTVPDQNEFITIDLPKRLPIDRRLLSSFVPYGNIVAKGRAKTTYSVIGDVPYGADQVAAFPGWIQDINAGRTDLTVHVGDIKNGSTRCDDEYFTHWRDAVEQLDTPLIYSPGDNEWTDCHRANNGAYNPLERLTQLRKIMFAEDPLGSGRAKVTSQASLGFPENVTWRDARVSFAAVHIVGSNNDLAPWTGLGKTEATPEQVAEEKARMGAALKMLDATFASARKNRDRAVVVFQQADMFDPTVASPRRSDYSAFMPYVHRLTDLAAEFPGKVYLVDGDSHIFHVDSPLAAGSPWLRFYEVKGSANNLTRITVDGSENNTNWLQMWINPGRGEPLGWQQVAFEETR